MRCDIFDVFEFAEHVELRKDSQGFEPNAVAPEQLNGKKTPMDDHGEDESAQIDEIVWEVIRFLVISEEKWLPVLHNVASVEGEKYENYLHDEEVHSFPPQEHVDIATQEHHEIDFLGLIREAY